MPQDILCPQCNKKFRVGDRPPATYNCTQCGLLMDLTPFGGRDRSAAPGARSRAPGPSRRSPSRAGGRRGGPPPREAYDDRRDGRFARPPPRNNAGLIIGVVAVLAAAVIVLVATAGDDAPARRVEKSEVDDTPSEPYAAEEPSGDDANPIRRPSRPKRKRKPRLGRIELETHAWPDEVDEATRTRVEAAIQDLYRGGRESLEAREYLISKGRPICGRLISEFKSIERSPGFEDRNGASMAMAIDGVLRGIDGWIERFWEEPARIRAWGNYAAPSFITRIAKRWTYWWIEDEWKTNPRAPWDPRVDETDPLEATAGPEEPAEEQPEDPKKPPGFSKPAGRD